MVEGVALEMLCRFLLTEGSNPSLSVLNKRYNNIPMKGKDNTNSFLSYFLKFHKKTHIKIDVNNILQLVIH